ncbi:MAG: ATP-binding protein [Victivallaceae bacterium]|jgi:signal transduction histidine kinase/CheY-like chemotaxis protein
MEYDAKALQKYFQDFKNQIDNKFFQVESRLSQIRIAAEGDLFESRANGIKFPFAYRFLKDKTGENYYHMDDIAEPYRPNIHTNITGNGSFRNRGEAFDRILKMGLSLSDDFYASRKTFPNLMYIYYISTEKLIVHHPWFASEKYKFEETLYDYETWKSSLPQNNPQRKIYWTKAYVDDSVGGGLMTSCAVPVYDQDNFIGLIGADLTVDFLNTTVSEFEPQRKGCMIIYDQDRNMLSHPLISYKDKTIRKLKEGLPPELAADLQTILLAPDNTVTESGRQGFIKARFANSPFSILYYFPLRTAFSRIIGQVGYGTLGLIVCLMLLVFASLYITHRQLIHPTEKFVNFILAKSRGHNTVLHNNIPSMWKTWFFTIEKVFNENTALTENIKRSNIELQNEIEAKNKAEIEKAVLEKQLIQEEKIRSVGLLAGGIAHDFNNQLSVIMGYTAILSSKKDLPDEKRLECLDHIAAAAGSSADLTRQLLAFAQRGNYQNIPVNIHDIIIEVISIFNHTIDKRIAIKCDLDAGLHTVRGDFSQLQNMIMNIAINAKNAMPNGGMITFGTSNVQLAEKECNSQEFELNPGNYIRIRITDTGTGIAEETKKHIFEPFFTTNNSGKGTGLGLAAAMGTIKNHHGSIVVESSCGIGATFIIELPVLEENALSQRTDRADALEISKSKARLLLIDDENAFCRMMTDFMSSLGYTVKAYSDPFQAMEYYQKSYNEIDLVITDMMMPKISGRDLIGEFEKINPRVKFVISSGYSIEEETRELLQSGKPILAFFKKPFNLIQFAGNIEKLLENKGN